MRRNSLWYFFAWLSFAFPTQAVNKTVKEEYLPTVQIKIDQLAKESEQLSERVTVNKSRIAKASAFLGFCIVVVPYSASWIIDGYFPEVKWVKDWLHYCFTPITQSTTLLMFYHNFSDADVKLKEAEGLLNESHEFFHDLGQICKNFNHLLEQNSGRSAQEVIEFQLNYLREERTPVGEYLMRIYQELQREKTIPFSVEEKRPIFSQIFSTILETIVGINSKKIKANKIIINFNGICLSYCSFLSLEILKHCVIGNFKSAGFEKQHNVILPFLENANE